MITKSPCFNDLFSLNPFVRLVNSGCFIWLRYMRLLSESSYFSSIGPSPWNSLVSLKRMWLGAKCSSSFNSTEMCVSGREFTLAASRRNCIQVSPFGAVSFKICCMDLTIHSQHPPPTGLAGKINFHSIPRCSIFLVFGHRWKVLVLQSIPFWHPPN